MFLGRFLAPNTLYQMRPTRGQMDLIWASYGHFWFSDFRKIFEKLKSAITRPNQIHLTSRWAHLIEGIWG